jgi:membrane protease subunit HflK
MGWNEPDNQKDPFGGKKQPPDLDEAIKRLQAAFKKAFFGQQKGKATYKPSSGNNGSSSGFGFLLSMAALVGLVLWALSGIFIVDPPEQAAILYFGKYKETVGPGPHWIPRIIASKIVVNVDRVSDYSYSAQMLTKDENLVSVSVAVQYRIGDLQEYLFNVADPQESLRQATSSALRQVMGTTTLDKIITEGREIWGSAVQDSLIKILSIYKTGMVIVNVSPQPARAPESVQEAFDDAIKAQEDEKRFKEQAYAYAARVVPIANGHAKRIQQESEAFARQVVLHAEGEVAEYLAILPEYLAAPEVTAQRMYLETMQKVLNNSSKIIAEGKSGNLLYLPLDKLTANLPASPKVLAENGTATSENLSPGRGPMRRSYEQGDRE